MNANLPHKDKLANGKDIDKRVDNDDTFTRRITQLVIPQITNNNPFEEMFFKGTNFHSNKNDFESLVLPAGCSGFSTFP
jgi:hypothetical protein